MILYYIFDKLPSPTERDAFGALGNFPLFFGTTLFALEAVGVVIALENNMKTPKSFGGVLNIGMVVIVFLYAGMGFFGYIKYGEQPLGSITLYLPEAEMYERSSEFMKKKINFLIYSQIITINQSYIRCCYIHIVWPSMLCSS